MRVVLSVLLGILFLGSPLFAVDLATKITDEVTVTATRNPVETKKLSRTVKVITRKDIDASGATTIMDVLQMVPGIVVNRNGGIGSPASVYVRGSKPGQTLVLIDGMELNDPMTPDRSVDLSAFPLDSVQRVDVVFGPASATYGSDAVAGVINIITSGGTTGGSIRVEGGANATWTTGVGYRDIFSLGSYWISGTFFDTNGISAADRADGNTEADGYTSRSFSGGTTFSFGRSTMNFTGIVVNADGDLDTSGGPGGDNPFYRFDRTEKHFKGSYELSNPFGIDGVSRFTVAYGDNERSYHNPSEAYPPTINSRFNGSLIRYNWHNQLLFSENSSLSFGLEYSREAGSSEYHSESSYGPYDDIFAPRHAITRSAYVSGLQHVLGMDVNIGLRYDDHEIFGSKVTGSFGVVRPLGSSGFRVRASAGTSFKSPTLYQLYSPYGTVELKPEKGRSYELGLENVLMDERLTVSLVWFHNRYDDMIDYDMNTNSYYNISRATIRGLEAGVRYGGETLSWQVFYNYYNTKDDTTGERLLRRPDSSFNAKLDYLRGRLGVHLNMMASGSRDDMDFSAWPAARVVLSSYTLFNLKVDYRIMENLTAYLKGRNVTDENYQLVRGYGTLGDTWYGGFVFRFHR